MKRKSFVPLLAYLMILSSLLLICNCSSDYCLSFRYDGPVRPLQEVAVLLDNLPVGMPDGMSMWLLPSEPYDITVKHIDGVAVEGLRCEEVHLLPGFHEIHGRYVWNTFIGEGFISYSLTDSSVTTYFEKGHVYIAKRDVNDVERGFYIEDLGTVEEVAPKMGWFIPPHWRELVEYKQKKE